MLNIRLWNRICWRIVRFCTVWHIFKQTIAGASWNCKK